MSLLGTLLARLSRPVSKGERQSQGSGKSNFHTRLSTVTAGTLNESQAGKTLNKELQRLIKDRQSVADRLHKQGKVIDDAIGCLPLPLKIP
jgi:hypothetical protein